MKKNSILTFSILLSLILFIGIQSNQAQEKQYRLAAIGYYNLENLFDTIDDPNKRDEEFTPAGSNRYTPERYLQKLHNLAKVISKVGTENTPDGLAILGVSEIENKEVLVDLANQESIKDRNYQIVHYHSPDRRGIDVGLLYQPKYFKLLQSSSHRLITHDTGFITRDQLLVSGIFDGDTLHLIVNHWPSRRGGEKRSRPFRNAAADLSRSLVDSLQAINPDAKIIVMGDLNDNPTNQSVQKHLRAKENKNNLKKGELYNPMAKLYKKGIGSNAWRDTWSLFDQVIVSQGLLNKDPMGYNFYNAYVYNKNWLKQETGRYKGYPHRTYAGGVFLGGYSDHFPVYLLVYKEL